MSHFSTDKQNHHPNLPKKAFKIRQQDFSAIGKHYVLDGERVRVKSIRYRDDRNQPKMLQGPQGGDEKIIKNKMINIDDIDEAEIEKLEYLEKMDVINEEQKHILECIRKARKQSPVQAKKITPQMSKVNPFTTPQQPQHRGQQYANCIDEQEDNYNCYGGNNNYY